MNDYEYQENNVKDENNTNITKTANEIRQKVARKGRPKKPMRKYEPLQKEEPIINDLEKYQNEPDKAEAEDEPDELVEKQKKEVLPIINEDKPLSSKLPEIEKITEEDVYEYILFKEFKKTMKNKKPVNKVDVEDLEEGKIKDIRKSIVKEQSQPKIQRPNYLEKFTSKYGDLF